MRLVNADALPRHYRKVNSNTGEPNGFWFVFQEDIDKAPTITIDISERAHGHWILRKTAAGVDYTICSFCKTSIKFNDEYGTVIMNLKGAAYCPACGARMDES